ncbi:MAG: DUF72 domain-containing protein [Pseudomonadota bacterium]
MTAKLAQQSLLRIGTAGWSIPAAVCDAFPGGGSHLERYSQILSAAEINSSFYRPHRYSTYVRWAEAVPAHFRFSVKLPREITHTRRLIGAESAIDSFLEETQGLGTKLDVILIQLPPSLTFDPHVAADFFRAFQERTDIQIALEPRHASWFTDEVSAWLTSRETARVAADPSIASGGDRPAGWGGLRYFRLHGSPEMYRSSYTEDHIRALAKEIANPTPPSPPPWCIFDNTASGAALSDALRLIGALETCHAESG